MPVQARYYTDPGCIWSWGGEGSLRRLMHEFGDQLDFRWVMGGMAREFGPGHRDSLGGIGSGAGCFEDLISHWLDVTAETGMPCDPRIWSQNPIVGTYPACMAVKAAAEQGAGPAYRYLRRLREGLICARRKLDHAEALIAEAAPAGLDAERFKVDLGSHAIVEAFGADLDEVRVVPDEARDADAVGETEGKQRVSFPSVLFIGENGERQGVWGTLPYEAYREAALAAGATPATDEPLPPLEAIARFGRAATQELEELSRRPRPVVEAELWALAKDWRLKPVPVLTGTLWEKS